MLEMAIVDVAVVSMRTTRQRLWRDGRNGQPPTLPFEFLSVCRFSLVSLRGCISPCSFVQCFFGSGFRSTRQWLHVVPRCLAPRWANVSMECACAQCCRDRCEAGTGRTVRGGTRAPQQARSRQNFPCRTSCRLIRLAHVSILNECCMGGATCQVPIWSSENVAWLCTTSTTMISQSKSVVSGDYTSWVIAADGHLRCRMGDGVTWWL